LFRFFLALSWAINAILEEVSRKIAKIKKVIIVKKNMF
jgi:hypothetical protein